MKKVYNALVAVSDAIFSVEKWLLLAAVVTVVGVNFVNVCLRYLAGGGLAFCEMLSICLFMFMVVIGGNIAAKTDGEIKIDIFKFKSPRANAGFRLIADVISVAAIILCLVGLGGTIEAVTEHVQRVTPLPIYTYHIYIVMTVGFVMILLDHVIVLLRHVLQLCGQTVEKEAKTA